MTDISQWGRTDTATLDRLRGSLADAASAASALDVAYTTIDSPVGTLLLAATERGILRVGFEGQGFDDILDSIASQVSSRILRAPKRLDAAARELDEYFSGARHAFDLPLDYALSHGFRQQVQLALPLITYGHTQSYSEVAAAVGNPRAVRAVGTACALNPLPIVIPCHRVVKADGSFGNYAGGPAAKATLLRLEAAAA